MSMLSTLQVHVDAACPFPCCMFMPMLMLHAHSKAHAACSRRMLHAHAYAACPQTVSGLKGTVSREFLMFFGFEN